MKKLFMLLSAFTIIGPGAAYYKLYFFHVVLVVIVFYHILLTIKNGKLNVSGINLISIRMFFIILIWNICSLLWSYEFTYTFKYIFYLSIGVLLIILIVTYTTDFQKLKSILNVAIITITVEIIISILEIFTNFRYPLSPYSPFSSIFGRSGFDESDFSEIALEYLATTPTGFMGNPNTLATVLVLFLPYFLFYKNRKFSIFFTFLTLVCIFYTGARGVIFTSLLVIIIYLSLYSWKKLLTFISILPLILYIGILFFGYAANSESIKLRELSELPNSIQTYISFDNSSSDRSISVRQTLIRNGLKAFLDTNLMGVGGGASKKVQEMNGSSITSMHNFWIELLVENGIFIFLCFVIWYVVTIILLAKIFYNKNVDVEMRRIAGATALSLIGFVFGAISASSTIYLLPMWFIFGISIVIIRLNKIERKKFIFPKYNITK